MPCHRCGRPLRPGAACPEACPGWVVWTHMAGDGWRYIADSYPWHEARQLIACCNSSRRFDHACILPAGVHPADLWARARRVRVA